MPQGRIMDTIKQYQRYPCMKPWIGNKYHSPMHKRLLVLGESHYLPKGSTVHLIAEDWYEKQQKDLSKEEVKWLSTSGIIENNKDKNFPKKAHGIYKNACIEINSCSFNYKLSSQAIEHFAYYNFFQRPAEVTGDSIKVKGIDKEVSILVLESVIKKLEPELIIFTSSLAGKFGKEVASKKGIPFVITPHPTCAWWNRTAKKYNGRGRDLISTFLEQYKWMA